MIAAVITLLALIGMALNLAFSGSLLQPDWSLALLLASLLAHRQNWIWVIPAILIHDFIFYSSFSASFVALLLLPASMIYLDRHLGSGLPQRVVLMFIAGLSLLWPEWGFPATILTICLALPLWHLMTRIYAQQAA